MFFNALGNAYLKTKEIEKSIFIELDENIKTEKANSKVTSKYQKNADDDFEKQMRQIGNVYCAGRIDGL